MQTESRSHHQSSTDIHNPRSLLQDVRHIAPWLHHTRTRVDRYNTHRQHANGANHPIFKRPPTLPIYSMAASCVLYYPERVFIQALDEPWKNSRQTAAQTAFTPNTNLRATLQDRTNVSRDLPTEEALYLEIEKLCTATLTIDEAFYDIGRRLSDASKAQNKRADLYDTCHTLETQWNEHHLVGSSFTNRKGELTGNIDISKPPLALQGVCWGSARRRRRYDLQFIIPNVPAYPSVPRLSRIGPAFVEGSGQNPVRERRNHSRANQGRS